MRINSSPIGFLHSVNIRVGPLLPAALTIVACGISVLYLYFVLRHFPASQIWDQDFFGIWADAKFTLTNRVAEIYDNSDLLDFVVDLGRAPRGLLPCVYPPFFLIIIAPIGLLSFYLALAIWNIFTFSVYFLISFYRQWRLSAIFLTIFAPPTVLNFMAGQTGFLSAALIVGGFRFVMDRPILGGTLFGLASFKPQLGILIPVALVSARLWRPLVAASATVVLLVVVSSLLFGRSIWPIWLAKLPAHVDWVVDVENRLSPTITANLTFLGVDLAVARVVQIAVAVVVAVVIWLCFRRGVTLLATAALLVGTFLATPYGWFYDMTMLTNAVLLVISHKDQTNRSLTIPEAVILLLSLVLPAVMLLTWRGSMFRIIPLLLLLGMIVWDLYQSRGDIVKSQSALVGKTANVG